MAKNTWLMCVCLVLLGLIIGGLAAGTYLRTPGYVPPLKVVGDVANCLSLQDLNGLGKLEKISFQGVKYKAVKLTSILNKAQPATDVDYIYYVALDGYVAAIKTQDIDDCYLAFTSQNGWEAINLQHPISSNAKQLTEIVLAAADSNGDLGFSIIKSDNSLINLSPGQLLTRTINQYQYAEGQANVQNSGKEYESRVFSRHRVFKLNDITPVNEGDKLLLIAEKGGWKITDSRGYFEVKDNYINYLQPESRSTVEKIKRVVIFPPTANIDVQHYLDSDKM